MVMFTDPESEWEFEQDMIAEGLIMDEERRQDELDAIRNNEI